MVKFQVVPFAFTLILLFWETLSWFLLLQKYGEGRRFSKKTFSRGKFMEGLFYIEGLMIKSFQGEGVSKNAFSSNLNNVNLKIFPNHDGIFT